MVSLHNDQFGVRSNGPSRLAPLRGFAEQHPFNWRMLVGVAGAAAFWLSVIALAPHFL